MDLGIAGRGALVAASSAGLGLATAQALALAGCRVVISGRDEGRLRTAAESVPGATSIVADVSDQAGATRLVDEARAALGAIDILITNAGGPPAGNFASTPLDAYQGALDLNLLSVVALCRAAVPAMQERRWGRVVAITSIAVKQPIALSSLTGPAPTIAPNNAINPATGKAYEGRTRAHQSPIGTDSRLPFPATKIYQVTQQAAGVMVSGDLPTQQLWTFDGVSPGPTYVAQYGTPILIRA